MRNDFQGGRRQRMFVGTRARRFSPSAAPVASWTSVECLEERVLLSGETLAVGPNVNVSHVAGSQTEPAIAVDPTNPSHLFAASNVSGNGLFGAVSTDGGAHWTTRNFANGADGLPSACCDPSVAFDSYGNLFITYLNAAATRVVVLGSTNGGQSFTALTSFGGSPDQPSIVTGPGSVWVTFQQNGRIVAAGAPVSGKGAIGSFSAPEAAPGSTGDNFGDIAVGPSGQVLVAYQTIANEQGPATIFVNLDADGLGGGGFGSAVSVTSTNVGSFDTIPAQSTRAIDAEVGLAWDRSGGIHNGRVYMVYTDESSLENNDTNIFLRSSDNNGQTWSARVRVNDDSTPYSQFFPRIAVDQTTGNVALTWYDARNDNGSGAGSTNALPNDDVQFYGTVSFDGGLTFAPNIKISTGTSNAKAGTDGNDFGDYTGLTFASGAFYPIWIDNSSALGGNPDRPHFDVATAKVTVSAGTPGVVVSLVATDAAAAETVSGAPVNTGTFRVTRTGATTAPLTVNYTISGSATNGSDYTSLSGSIVIPAGQTSASLTIAPIDNLVVEPAEAVILTLAASAAYGIDAGNSTATVTIADNDIASGPANDNFANRIPLSNSSLLVRATGSNVGATRETGEPNNAGVSGGKSVWWSWTAPVNGVVLVSTATSLFDTTLGVYTGTSVGALKKVAANDDQNTALGVYTSRVSFTAVAGVTYQISVDGYNGDAGSIALKVSETASTTAAARALLTREKLVQALVQQLGNSGTRSTDAPFSESQLLFLDTVRAAAFRSPKSLSQSSTEWSSVHPAPAANWQPEALDRLLTQMDGLWDLL